MKPTDRDTEKLLGKDERLIIQLTQKYLTITITHIEDRDTFKVKVRDRRVGDVMIKELTTREFIERVTYLEPKYMLYEMDRRLDGDEELYEFWEEDE